MTTRTSKSRKSIFGKVKDINPCLWNQYIHHFNVEHISLFNTVHNVNTNITLIKNESICVLSAYAWATRRHCHEERVSSLWNDLLSRLPLALAPIYSCVQYCDIYSVLRVSIICCNVDHSQSIPLHPSIFTICIHLAVISVTVGFGGHGGAQSTVRCCSLHTHSLTHSLMYSLTHSTIHAPTHQLTHSLIQSLTH